MKFASYNIQFGIGLDGKYDLARIASSLAGADVIALQEVTRGFHRNGHTDLVEGLSALFPDYYVSFGPACDVYLDSSLSEGRRVERRFQFGNMILSRWPILASRMLLLPRARTYDKLNLQRGASEVVVDIPGRPLRVYSVHLDHISPDERISQISALKDYANHFVAHGGALTGAADFDVSEPPLPDDYILMGDFNMQPESPEYTAMVGPVDAYYGRTLRYPHPVDALAHLGRLGPQSYSWMDPHNHDRRMHLDYGFVSCGLVPRLKDAFVDLQAEGSDHFPLWLEID